MLYKFLRRFFHDKLYALINILGLSVAMTSCIVLGLFLRNEFTYDRHNEQFERIYRLETEYVANGRHEHVGWASWQLAPMLANDYPELGEYVRFRSPGYWETGTNRLIRHAEDAAYWEDIYYADANVFDVFTHEIIYGDPETALVDPSSAAVSRSFARRYFGEENPLGETLTMDNGEQKVITLVFADLPDNTHMKYDVLFSYNSIAPLEDDQERIRELFGAGDFTYLVLPETFDVGRFDAMARDFFDRHMTGRAEEIALEGWNASLMPLKDIHLYSTATDDLPAGNLNYLIGLEVAVAFILLIACFNHVNLTTAGAARRAHEIGIRKVLGGSRLKLALRFMGESVFLCLVALLVSYFLLEVVLPRTPVTTWLGRPALLSGVHSPVVIAMMAGFSLLTGVLSGIYPALYLSSVPVLQAMHKADTIGKSGLKLREVLVFFQFAITGCVISCVFIMAAQMKYLSDRPLGYKDHGLMTVTLRGVDVLQQIPVIEKELESNNRILGVSVSDSRLGTELPNALMETETNEGLMKGILVRHLPVAFDFIDVAGMEIVDGRNFSPDIATDPREAFIVNEALVRQMGWDEPLGKRMGIRGRKVIGVVKDFNFQSLHVPVQPLIMYQNVSNFGYIPADQQPFKLQYLLLNVDMSNLAGTLNFIERTIARFDPAHPFEYQFLDQAMNSKYVDEQRLMNLIAVFAGVCIFIACLGLFGLSTFTASQRAKEIGIRKVLGATVAQIMVMLSKKTLLLIAVSSLVAWLAAYTAMNRWLSVFAYRIDIGFQSFILSTCIVVAVAMLTLTVQGLKHAMAHPVNSLRTE